MRLLVLGNEWKLKTFSDEGYEKKHGAGTDAVTHLSKSYIHFRKKGLSIKVIIHELVHAYLVEMCTHSAMLDEEQLEEVFADLMAGYGYEILTKAEKVFGRLKK